MNYEEKLNETEFFIEASDYEIMSLWDKHKHDVSWEEDQLGCMLQVGELGEHKPVNISCTFTIINGKRVCFYDNCSRYSDSKMVEEFLETKYPVTYDSGSRRAMTNAMNFHHALHHCQGKV